MEVPFDSALGTFTPTGATAGSIVIQSSAKAYDGKFLLLILRCESQNAADPSATTTTRTVSVTFTDECHTALSGSNLTPPTFANFNAPGISN